MATTRHGQIGVGVESYDVFQPKGVVARGPEQFTRLGQIGVGVETYAGFEAKAGAARPPITRLTQIGVGGARYLGFQAKAAAQPEQPEQPETPAVVGLPRFPAVLHRPIIGDAEGELPPLLAGALGSHGVVGRGAVALPELDGNAEGQVVAAADGAAAIVGLSATSEADHGADGEGQVNFTLRGAAGAVAGSAGDGLAALSMITGRSRGEHDPDDIALLLAA